MDEDQGKKINLLALICIIGADVGGLPPPPLPYCGAHYGSCVLTCCRWRVAELPGFNQHKIITEKGGKFVVLHIPEARIGLCHTIVLSRKKSDVTSEMAVTYEEEIFLNEVDGKVPQGGGTYTEL